MESMQATLEAEQRAKAEGLRVKKKLEGDINELEIGLDHSNKANAEALKSIKRYQGQLREAHCAYEEASRVRQEISEKAGLEKLHLASAIHTMHAEIDDMLHSAKNSEEKAKKAMVDAARLADELRAEQDHTDQQIKGKRALEAQLGEMEQRLAEAG